MQKWLGGLLYMINNDNGKDSHIDTQLTALLDVFMEEFHERSKLELEDYEDYVQRIRSKLYVDETLFRSRFVQGYHSLLEELKYERNSHETARPDEGH